MQPVPQKRQQWPSLPAPQGEVFRKDHCKGENSATSRQDQLLQIVLAGTLELRDGIMARRNKALRRRIFAPCLLNVNCHLHPIANQALMPCEKCGWETEKGENRWHRRRSAHQQ
jgi:hypothetical protein